MIFLLAIVVFTITSIIPLFLSSFNGIVSSHRDRVFLVPFFFKIFFFFIYVKGLDRLIGARQSGGLAVSWLCFLRFRLLVTRFFGGGSLGLQFDDGGCIRKTVTSKATDIQVSDHDAES